jgi:hypothetical protein
MDSMGMGGGSMGEEQMNDHQTPMQDQGGSMEGKMPTRTEPMQQGRSMGMK